MRKPKESKKPKTYAIFMNKLNYVKKNLAPGSVVAMKDQRADKYVSRDENGNTLAKRTYIVEKLYDNYALCVNDIGLTECFGYYDLTVAYERGELSLYDVNWRR
jgi:hypothetical protein